jgi:pyridoxine 4-dehydrogenase
VTVFFLKIDRQISIGAHTNKPHTSGAYGPRVTNELIREALHPYPASLHVVTKVGAQRDERGGRPPARRPADLRHAVRENRETLGLDRLDLVNLRLGDARGPQPGSLAEAFGTLAELQREGLIRHLGVSGATAAQVAEARAIAPVVCVQNLYNLAHRHDDELIDELAGEGIAYVPFFPLGGFSPLQSSALSAVASRLATTPMAVALAWLLRRSPNILLIPGTSSVAHLTENVAGAGIRLSDDDLAELDEIGRKPVAAGSVPAGGGGVGVRRALPLELHLELALQARLRDHRAGLGRELHAELDLHLVRGAGHRLELAEGGGRRVLHRAQRPLEGHLRVEHEVFAAGHPGGRRARVDLDHHLAAVLQLEPRQLRHTRSFHCPQGTSSHSSAGTLRRTVSRSASSVSSREGSLRYSSTAR